MNRRVVSGFSFFEKTLWVKQRQNKSARSCSAAAYALFACVESQ
jgi:hypothetical protein